MGKSSSCGCYQKERNPEILRTHGMSYSDEYLIWGLIKGRCTNPKLSHYKTYGGRGISVCSRWFDSFENFYADMGPRPSKLHTIDRYPDVDGNYEPNNCRWATRKEQARNRRDNRCVVYEGKRMTLSKAVERSGFSRSTLNKRLKKGSDLFAPVHK
jgi:hypothetical protein